MNEAEFRRAYAQIEDNIQASNNLKRKTKEACGISSADQSAKYPSPVRGALQHGRTRPMSHRPTAGVGVLIPAFKTAFAACLVVTLGVALLFGVGQAGSLFAGNSFSLVAYAEETAAPGAHAGIGLEMFHPSRTSAGYLWDAASDTVDFNVVTVNRYYAFDMTATGNNVKSVSYKIEGEGAVYGAWQTGKEHEGRVAEGSSTSFTISYDDGDPVIREIGLSYVLDEQEKAEFDQLYEVKDYDGTEALLVTCDAKRLSNVTFKAIATFFDGTTMEKVYGFVPVEGFENMYQAYLDQLAGGEDTQAWDSLVGEPALFQLVEKNR